MASDSTRGDQISVENELPSWTLSGEGGARVAVEVLRYERPQTRQGSDADWLVCNVRASMGAFKAEISAALETQAMVSFQSALEKVVAASYGVAEFHASEDWLFLRVELGNLGSGDVNGYVQSPGAGLRLNFVFHTDQTFLRATVADLQVVNSLFPVR